MSLGDFFAAIVVGGLLALAALYFITASSAALWPGGM